MMLDEEFFLEFLEGLWGRPVEACDIVRIILLNLLCFVNKLLPQIFYPSAWADQRSPLGDIENNTGGYHPVVLVSANQRASKLFIEAIYQSSLLITSSNSINVQVETTW